MAITNFSAARRAGFKAGNRGIGKDAAIAMSKMGTRTLTIPLPPAHWHFVGAGVVVVADGIFAAVTLPNANTGNMLISSRVPAELKASTDIFIDIYWKTTVTSGDAKFTAKMAFKEKSETTAQSTASNVVTTTNGTANKLNKSTIGFVSSFIAGDWIGFHLERIPGGSDTLGADLNIIGVVIRFTGVG